MVKGKKLSIIGVTATFGFSVCDLVSHRHLKEAMGYKGREHAKKHLGV